MKIIKRREAIELGLRRYFTGRACKNGHFSERDTTSGRCFECVNEWNKSRTAYIADWQKNKMKNKLFRKKRNDSNSARRDKSIDYAANSNQRWSISDINQVLLKKDNGDYAYSESELVKRLGRSLRAVFRARNRFKDLE